MFWTEKKLAIRINELSEYRYRDTLSVPSFDFQLDENGEVGTYPPQNGEWEEIKVGEIWRGRDLYAWLSTEVVIPAEWKGRTIVGRFDFGRTGGGGNFGFESLLYLNGSPYQGVDMNHQEVFLPDDSPSKKLQLNFRLWSGTEGGGIPQQQEHKLKRAVISWLDETTDDLFFTSQAISDTVDVLDENDPNRIALLKALDRTFLEIDWSSPGSDHFYTSIQVAHKVLLTELSVLEKHHAVTIRCIGHTHIDVAWRWQLKHTREKAARSFSTVLRLMERYPDYTFLQTQPQLYEYIKQDYPEIYDQIKKRVKEGRWEVEGAMWLEADCNIPSGESLVRQILVGTRFLREEFGAESTYLWLPDVFGYSWALPQILKKSGIDTFMTTKISWSQYNRMPHDTFQWRGIDGSEVLTHFITTAPKGKNTYTYNGTLSAPQVTGIWDNYRDKKFNQELLLAYGHGDGGGGVTRDMLERRRRFEQLPGMPNVVTGRADEYFERLQESVESTDQYVHTWDGELYLEFHRGTYTSQALIKRMNRKLELLYREAEWINVIASTLGSTWSSYPQKQLTDGWKIILRNQFHDIIPGSSIGEVYEDSLIEHKEAQEIGSKAWNQTAKSLVDEKDHQSVSVFNSSPWQRDDYVTIPVELNKESGTWLDGNGKALKAQRLGNNWLVRAQSLPSMGVSTLYFDASKEAEEKNNPFSCTSSSITTPYYKLEWNEQGQLTKLYDRHAERDVLAEGERGNVLQVFEDKPMRFDAWDIDIFYQEKMQEILNLKKVSTPESGPLRTIIRFEWEYMESSIVQDMIVYAEEQRIDFVTKVDWHESQQLLKVAFPVDIRSTEATYDIQYGNVKRPTHWNTSWDAARFETVGHQWADLSEQSYGVSLLNDCKYGYDIKDNVMRLTLIKSGIFPDPHADQGEHLFTYSLYPHKGDWREGNTVMKAWELNNPLTFIKGKRKHDEPFSLFHLSADHVMIDAVKKAEDDNRIVVRVHEFKGARGSVRVNSDATINSWQETDLMERPISDVFKGESIDFKIKPYEIKTFLIEME
ncbi:alpha-mannosidase [Radiobacillus sp. PE A8.2]|uniref:alpha-mannosidase n=1 Tax=Radiobacillus sp. PE A8.2 TaxID=3380349 RepID=UPI00388E1BAA